MSRLTARNAAITGLARKPARGSARNSQPIVRATGGSNSGITGSSRDSVPHLASVRSTSHAKKTPSGTAIAVVATLRDAKGLPLAFQAVSFALKTTFGTVAYGSRPTNEQGKVQLTINERRYGQWPFEVGYDGGEGYEATRAEIQVDFGSRPAPALPAEGVLISPYPTAIIALPFLLFYGTMWVVFGYVFGYLILGRMRRSGAPGPR